MRVLSWFETVGNDVLVAARNHKTLGKAHERLRQATSPFPDTDKNTD
jgi:short-subunit dehydrogenase involved in D-alanine esterification of teichoic acids